MPILIPSTSPATVAWLDWSERLQLRLKECPAVVIADELRECAIRFYRDGRVWKETGIALATTVLGQADYTVTIAADRALAGLPAIWMDDVEVAEAVPGSLDDVAPNDSASTIRIAVMSDNTIRIAPTPPASGVVVTATVAYCPTDTATGITTALYFAHRDTIEDMAMERLMTQPGKPWTDLLQAVNYGRLSAAGALFDSTMAGPVRRTRIRTKKQVI
jgi:hypothetical protein